MTTTLIRQTVLETPRLTLRKPRKSDIGLMSQYTSDYRVAKMTTTIPHPNPPGAVEVFLERVANDEGGEVVWTLDASKGFNTEVVGIMALRPQGEVGYWIAPFFWGVGLASEALQAVTSHAFDIGHRKLSARVFKDNPASKRVLEKAGFEVVGEGQAYSVARDDAVFEWILERERDDAR